MWDCDAKNRKIYSSDAIIMYFYGYFFSFFCSAKFDIINFGSFFLSYLILI
jgi:hypothetical protein